MRRSWKRGKRLAKNDNPVTGKKRKKHSPPLGSARRRSSGFKTRCSGSTIQDKLAQKRTEFIQQTSAEMIELQAEIEQEQIRVQDMGEGRMYILLKRTTTEKIKSLQKRLTHIQTGRAIQEFDEKMKSFRKLQNRIERRLPSEATSASEKRKRTSRKPSTTRPSGNRRKSAAHHRDIRVSSCRSLDATFEVLADEIGDEFGHEEGAAPVLYVCNRNYCPSCETVLMQKLPAESALVCPDCGVQTSYLDSTAATTGHSDDRSFNQFAYCRANHFLQWLRACQGKESVTIPDTVLEGVCAELAKNRVRVEDITSKKVREVLKIMKQRKYYENVVLITSLLTGKKPPRFSPTVEQTLQRLFMKIQKPFEIAVRAICPERKNFLSYSYILTKLCTLIRDSIDPRWLTAFSCLKGKDKIYKSDKLWCHMCKQLNWRYYPSI